MRVMSVKGWKLRSFFIDWSEKLIGVFVVLMLIGVVVAGFSVMISPQGNVLFGLLFIFLGLVYAIIIGGLMYLFFGIYRNTGRTNVLLEQLLQK